MSKRRKYLPEEKIKIVKSFAVQIRIQLIVECDFPINVLGFSYKCVRIFISKTGF